MGEKKLDEKWTLTAKEAMEYVGWKTTKFWALVERGEIVGRKDGHWRFDRVELDKYKKRMNPK